MSLSTIEKFLLNVLSIQEIRGTAQVGYALWPDRNMQPQGAALAAGKILRSLRDKGFVSSADREGLSCYAITTSGRFALKEAQESLIDPRQLSLID